MDDLVTTLNKLVLRINNRAQQQLDEFRRTKHHTMQQSIVTMRSLATVILDESQFDSEVRTAIFEQIPREQLLQQVHDSDELLSARQSHVFHRIVDRYEYIRRFFPMVLEHIECLESEQEPLGLVMAMELLKSLNREGKRTIPKEAPLDFLSTNMKAMVQDEEGISRRAWECAVLVSLNEAIKTGNLSIQQSKRFGLLSDYFIDEDAWEECHAPFFQRAGLPQVPEAAPHYLKQRLNQAFDEFLAAQEDNAFAQVNEEGWQVSIDAADKLHDKDGENLQKLKTWLAKHMRSIRLPELLIEVDNELHMTKPFLPQALEICVMLKKCVPHS